MAPHEVKDGMGDAQTILRIAAVGVSGSERSKQIALYFISRARIFLKHGARWELRHKRVDTQAARCKIVNKFDFEERIRPAPRDGVSRSREDRSDRDGHDTVARKLRLDLGQALKKRAFVCSHDRCG